MSEVEASEGSKKTGTCKCNVVAPPVALPLAVQRSKGGSPQHGCVDMACCQLLSGCCCLQVDLGCRVTAPSQDRHSAAARSSATVWHGICAVCPVQACKEWVCSLFYG